MYGGDEVGALVLDVGTANVKAGYAGEDTPKTVFPSEGGFIAGGGNDSAVGESAKAVGETEAMEIDNQKPKQKGEYFIGTERLWSRREHMEMKNLMQNGLVTDFELLEQIWDYTFFNRLRSDPREHPVLLAEPSFNTRAIRERMTEMFFEKYQAPALFISKNAVLTAFANGKASALVLDSGAGVTSVTPVHDGYVLQKGIVKSSLAGNLLTDEYLRSFDARGIKIQPHYNIKSKELTPAGQLEISLRPEAPGITASYKEWAVKQIVRDIKETHSRVSDIAFDEAANVSIPSVPYELPDGKILELGTDRFSIPELMFNPKPLNERLSPSEEFQGVPQMLLSSIAKCDVDIRREYYNGILITGGNSLLAGFPERVHKEMADRSPAGMYKVKVLATGSTSERKFSVFIGGSILGSLGSFQQMWMSKKEYEEHGKSIVESKCP